MGRVNVIWASCELRTICYLGMIWCMIIPGLAIVGVWAFVLSARHPDDEEYAN